ncbi:hypothetical protein F5884DRAFT_473714 [Xylogone sp. PMI_703]|nr:hypothetical protein F5884DRAFT_473714 [Xylogone sp. PMI_703]
MRFLLTVVVSLVAAGRGSLAQRPSNSSICDYYATTLYGTNTSTTQFRLMQNIVALAFGGGTHLPGASNDSTGILNPGTFEGLRVNLRSWFDGSKATTNLNNQPVGINWLDGGAQAPLMSFLDGDTDNVVIANTTNEYRLFTHFFTAFGFIFDCSLVRDFPKTNESGGPINLAYVHKYMNLNQTHLGHFIDQLTTASKYFGFSDTDAETLSTYMNSRYNIRCAPPINGMLNSLCQATECPLAAPSPDCAAYVDIGPGGAGNDSSPPPQTTAPSSPSSTPSSDPTSTSSTPPPTSTTATPTSGGSKLSSGAIAGIAIGGAAVVLIAVGLLLYFLRRRPSRRQQQQQPQMMPAPYQAGGYGSPIQPTHTPDPHHQSFPPGPHESYMSSVPSGYYIPKPPDHPGFVPAYDPRMSPPPPPPQSPPMVQIAEMDSPHSPPLHHSVSPSGEAELGTYGR